MANQNDPKRTPPDPHTAPASNPNLDPLGTPPAPVVTPAPTSTDKSTAEKQAEEQRQLDEQRERETQRDRERAINQ